MPAFPWAMLHHRRRPVPDDDDDVHPALQMIVPSRPFPAVSVLFRPVKQNREFLERMSFYSYGRLALLHGMIQLGLRPGDAILVPAYYCESGLQCLKAHGFDLVFVDVDEHLQLSPEAVKIALSLRRIKAVLLTHFFGFAQEFRDEIIVLCRAAGIKVVEDCSHSFLSCLHQNARLEPDAYVFSMRKNLPVSDGGALLLGRRINRETRPMHKPHGSLLFDLPFVILRTIEETLIRLGWPNLYGPPISRLKAALNRSGNGMEEGEGCQGSALSASSPSYCLMRYLSSEPYLRCVAESRAGNYRKLSRALAALGLKTVMADISSNQVPQVFPVVGHARTLSNYLRRRKIGAFRWPGEEIPAAVKSNPSLYPNAIRWNESIVCLPIHQDINDRHISFMVGAISDWIESSSTGSA